MRTFEDAWSMHDQTARNFEYKENDQTKNKHCAQNKLLCAEVEFLTKHCKSDNAIVVYAGAAPGIHLCDLANLFSYIKFYLYDIASFDCRLMTLTNVCLFAQKFTDCDARRWNAWHASNSECNLFFISDIRTTFPHKNYRNMSQVKRENVSTHAKQKDDRRVQIGIMNDMKNQKQWVEIMTPTAALLKFRPPYYYDWAKTPCYYSYLPGTIMLPVWGPKHTTECKLDVDVNAMLAGKQITIDVKNYENVMGFFNVVIRWQNIYDLRRESEIWKNYRQHIVTRYKKATFCHHKWKTLCSRLRNDNT